LQGKRIARVAGHQDYEKQAAEGEANIAVKEATIAVGFWRRRQRRSLRFLRSRRCKLPAFIATRQSTCAAKNVNSRGRHADTGTNTNTDVRDKKLTCGAALVRRRS
jgi:hypothetical protein